MSRTRGHRKRRRDYGEPGCWCCMDADEKKRVLEDRILAREDADIAREIVPDLVNYPTCTVCSRPATWWYAPSPSIDYCDDHVPRGCSCVDDPTEPCIEFHEYEETR